MGIVEEPKDMLLPIFIIYFLFFEDAKGNFDFKSSSVMSFPGNLLSIKS